MALCLCSYVSFNDVILTFIVVLIIDNSTFGSNLFCILDENEKVDIMCSQQILLKCAENYTNGWGVLRSN